MAKRQREKSENIEKTRDRRPTAIARYIRIPSSKVEIVLDLVRGKSYIEARAILANTNKSASPVILKVLESAAANAENNLNILKDNLYVAECYSMAGPTLKRMMPRARGRADRILKRTCHIRVTLDEKAEKEAVVKTNATRQKKNTPAKEVPDTQSERPLTDRPNTKKPLGTKSVSNKSTSKAAQVTKDTKTAKSNKKEEMA